MKVIAGGHILNYEQVDQGVQNVLILPGWGRTIKEWTPLAQSLNGYKTILLDLPGFGESEQPLRTLDTYDYSQIVLEFIKKIEIYPCIIIGHSFGGRIATILASEHPENVKKIILVDSGGIEIKSLKVKLKILFYKIFLKHVKKIIPKKIKRFFGSSDYKAISGNLQKSFVKIVSQDLRHLFKNIHQPVVVIWGNNDTVLPVNYIKIYRELIPQALIRIVWSAGHSPHIDRQKDFTTIIQEVL